MSWSLSRVLIQSGAGMVDQGYRPISILFLADEIEDVLGGTEQHISFLLNYLPRERYECHLMLLRDTGYCYSLLYPIQLIILNFESFRNPLTVLRSTQRLARFIRSHQIDVAHTFFPDSELLALLATQLQKSCKLVATRRNMGFRHTRMGLWRTRLVNQFIPKFLSNSLKVKETVEHLEWIKQEKIEVIYNPVPYKRIEGGLRQHLLKQDLGLQEKEQVVGIVGTIAPVKDHETFLSAARLILDQRPRTKFLLIGGSYPDTKSRLEANISKLGLGSSVIFAGQHDNPVPLMKLFDVAVLCSTSEGLSNALIEYAAVGLPTVATQVGGNPEVVIHGKTGFLVPPSSPELLAQRVLALLGNDEMRRTFGENARRLATDRFDQDKILSDYENFYQTLVNQV